MFLEHELQPSFKNTFKNTHEMDEARIDEMI